MASTATPAPSAPAQAGSSELLRHLAAELRLLAARVRVSEPREPPEELDRERFWRRLSECHACLGPSPPSPHPSLSLRPASFWRRRPSPACPCGGATSLNRSSAPDGAGILISEDDAAVTVAREATTLTVVFRLPLPSPQETKGICERVHAAVKAVTAVYCALPRDQGITLRKLVRGTTLDIVDGMAQLVEVLLIAPAQSPENSDLISCNSVWDACQQVPQIPRDNKAAALLMLTKSVDFVKDAHEEMEQAVKECDPHLGLAHDSEEDSSGGCGGEDEVLGFPSSQDVHWSEEDRELIAPCLALVRASKACLKKIQILVAENGKKDQVAQLDDIIDISEEISPSVDDLALSIYPPMCHLTVRINSAKLVSVLRKALEVTKKDCLPRLPDSITPYHYVSARLLSQWMHLSPDLSADLAGYPLSS